MGKDEIEIKDGKFVCRINGIEKFMSSNKNFYIKLPLSFFYSREYQGLTNLEKLVFEVLLIWAAEGSTEIVHGSITDLLRSVHGTSTRLTRTLQTLHQKSMISILCEIAYNSNSNSNSKSKYINISPPGGGYFNNSLKKTASEENHHQEKEATSHGNRWPKWVDELEVKARAMPSEQKNDEYPYDNMFALKAYFEGVINDYPKREGTKDNTFDLGVRLMVAGFEDEDYYREFSGEVKKYKADLKDFKFALMFKNFVKSFLVKEKERRSDYVAR